MNTHYYILPDGNRADNMKDGCEAMGINRRSFQNLVKKQIVKKVLLTNTKLKEDEKTANKRD